jgi:uncharacterized protein YggE
MKLVRIAAAAGLVALVAVFAGVGRPDGAQGQSAGPQADHTITVSGTGSVQTVPDQAQLSFGVTTQAAGATQALTSNAALARRVIAALVGAGVARADIQTQYVSISPQYSGDGSTIVGYTATNSVSATLRALDKAGSVVDAAVSAGANQVYGPSLLRSDQDALYRSALRLAVADARTKAQALAAAGGVTLGGVLDVVEGQTPQPVPFERGAAATSEPTPIEPGTQTIQATVTVEFALR